MADTQLTEIIAALHQRLAPEGRVDKSINFLSYSGDRYLRNAPQIVCADGFSMSVQASHAHYCTPRDSEGPWTAVEVGYPSAKVDAFMPHIDGDGAPTDTVYGYVPLEIVAQTILEHGGFVAA